jgi:hypothetical protein
MRRAAEAKETLREILAGSIFAGGKIVEEWMNTDMLGLLRQLGVVPG